MQSLDTSVGSRALGPDQTISSKVQSTISAAAQQAKAVDEQKGITKTAGDVSNFLSRLLIRRVNPLLLQYYTRALSSPFGQKVREFYTTTSKQVLDIHEEASRISSEHKAAAASNAPAGQPATPVAPV